MTVSVVMARQAQKDFDRLPAVLKARVAEVLQVLPQYPNVPNVRALTGALAGTYRVRVGGYRILFALSKNALTVIGIRDRKDAY